MPHDGYSSLLPQPPRSAMFLTLLLNMLLQVWSADLASVHCSRDLLMPHTTSGADSKWEDAECSLPQACCWTWW